MRLCRRSRVRRFMRAGNARKVARRHRAEDDGSSQTNVIRCQSQTDELQLVTRTSKPPRPPYRLSENFDSAEMIFSIDRSPFGRAALRQWRLSVA